MESEHPTDGKNAGMAGIRPHRVFNLFVSVHFDTDYLLNLIANYGCNYRIDA